MWNVCINHSVSRNDDRIWALVAEDHRVARADVLDPDRRVVHADRVPASRPERHELVDGAVAIDHEMRTRSGELTVVSRVRRERVPRPLERRPAV